MVNDLTFQKGLGANMVRKHMKVETDRWYHLTDTLGLLVWQVCLSCDSPPCAHRSVWRSACNPMVSVSWDGLQLALANSNPKSELSLVDIL